MCVRVVGVFVLMFWAFVELFVFEKCKEGVINTGKRMFHTSQKTPYPHSHSLSSCYKKKETKDEMECIYAYEVYVGNANP